MPVDGSYEAQLAEFDADLDRLVRRLQSLTAHSWRAREGAVRSVAQDLADLAAALDGRSRRTVPDLPAYGLAAAIAVLGGDVVASLAEREHGAALDQATELVVGALRDTV